MEPFLNAPKGKSYLITGAAGFIGSHLGNRLAQLGNTVLGIDSYLHASKNPLNFHCERSDVRQPEYVAMRARNMDAIIHLAAVVNIDNTNTFPEIAKEINLDATFQILEVARRMDVPLVYASSSEVYGTAQATFMTETHPLDGQSPYAATKTASDRMCKAWRDTYGMDINIVRLFNTFGPYQADDGYGGVIAKFVRQTQERKPMTIYGKGLQRRDYLWVDDAVNAWLLALTVRFDGPVNFGTGTTVSILDIASDIYDGIQPVHVEPRRGEVDVLRCGWDKAKAMGWSPRTDFATGIREYILWSKTTA